MDQELNQYLVTTKKRELIKRGLYDVKYYTKNEAENQLENPNIFHYKNRYFEYIPYEVTDEEYEQILKSNFIRHDVKEYDSVYNTDIYKQDLSYSYLPNILNALALFIIFVGIVLVFKEYSVSYLFGGFVSSMIFFALAKIVRLLEEIRNK